MQLFKTTAFRVALQFAVGFTLLSVITLLSVYYFTIHEVEVQVERELVQELNELTPYYKKDNTEALFRITAQRAEYGEHFRHYYALSTLDGEVLLGNAFLLKSEIVDKEEKEGVLFVGISEFLDEDYHAVYIKTAQRILSPDLKLIVGQAKNSLNELREHVFIALLWAVLVTVFLGIIIGTYMGKSVISRINRIDKGMDAVIESDFTQLLTVPKQEDEFQALTIKLNVMLGRIENLLNGMRQVSDNIAHDLRSPLTRMRSRIEVTLLQEREAAEYREVMHKVIDDCDYLLRTFNALLAIAQAESGSFRENLEKIELNELIEQLAELYRAVAEDQGLRFVWRKSGPVFVSGRRQALAQAVNNLLENAIKYTPGGGTITVSVGCDKNEGPFISVADTGSGIPEKDRERVLARFQRLDAARTKPGSGLGLSLVDAVVKLHDAQLILSDNSPGLKVEIRFSGEC